MEQIAPLCRSLPFTSRDILVLVLLGLFIVVPSFGFGYLWGWLRAASVGWEQMRRVASAFKEPPQSA
jgi:hypothetical protein